MTDAVPTREPPDQTIEERILEGFLLRIEKDKAVPPEVAARLRALAADRRIGNKDSLLSAVRDGVAEHAKSPNP